MAVVRGAKFEVEGLNELEKQFERVGKMPKKHLTRSAKLGMEGPFKEAKRAIKKGKTGLMKKGLARMMERSRSRQKTVYRLRFHPRFTQYYQKPTTGIYGGKTPNAYYPNSVEYGYKVKRGRIEGKYWIRDVVRKHEKNSLEIVVKSLQKSITELLDKG